MQEIRYPNWEKLYQEAILEFDPTKLVSLIDQAEAALLRRQRELMAVDAAEQLAIKGCLFALRAIRRTSRSPTADPERIHR
jgi:hypothetical protein